MFFDLETGDFLPDKFKAYIKEGIDFNNAKLSEVFYQYEPHYCVIPEDAMCEEIAPGLFEFKKFSKGVGPGGRDRWEHYVLAYDPTTKDYYNVIDYETYAADYDLCKGRKIKSGDLCSEGTDQLSAERFLALRGKSEYLDNAMQKYVDNGVLKVDVYYQANVDADSISQDYIDAVAKTIESSKEKLSKVNDTRLDRAMKVINRSEELRPGIWGKKDENGNVEVTALCYDNQLLTLDEFINYDPIDSKRPEVNNLLDICISRLADNYYNKGADEEFNRRGYATPDERMVRYKRNIAAMEQLYAVLTGNTELSIASVGARFDEQEERYGKTSKVDMNITQSFGGARLLYWGGKDEEPTLVDKLQDIAEHERSIPWYAKKDYGEMPETFAGDNIQFYKEQLIAAGFSEDQISGASLEMTSEYVMRRIIADLNFPKDAFFVEDDKLCISLRNLVNAENIAYDKLGVELKTKEEIQSYWFDIFNKCNAFHNGNDLVMTVHDYFKTMYESNETLHAIFLTSVAADNCQTKNDVMGILNDALTMTVGMSAKIDGVPLIFESVYGTYQGDNEEFFNTFCEAYPEINVLKHLFNAKCINDLPIVAGGALSKALDLYKLVREACSYFGRDYYAYKYEDVVAENYTPGILAWAKACGYPNHYNTTSFSELSYDEFKSYQDWCDNWGGSIELDKKLINILDNYFRAMGYYEG